MKDKNIYIYTTIIVLIALIIGCLFCFIICRKNTSSKNENIERKQNSVQQGSMSNILYTDEYGNISTGQLQSNKLVQSNSVGQLQSLDQDQLKLKLQSLPKLGLGITGEIWNDVTKIRVAFETYTNLYTYPIGVSIVCLTGGGSIYKRGSLFINNNVVNIVEAFSDRNIGTLVGIVPPGHTYKVILENGATINGSWIELY